MSTPLITGIDRTIRGLKKMKDRDAMNIRVGIEKCVQMVWTKSQVYVPVEFGDLKASGETVVVGKALQTEGLVHYGGPAAPHAFVVHERVELRHAPPTCARYLSRAVRELRGSMTNMMGRQLGIK
jgi:hypothetical protein